MGKRLFIGIGLNTAIKEKINKLSNQVEKISSSSLVTPKENLHITLLFLGNVEEDDENKIKDIIKAIAEKYKSFLAVAFCLKTFKKNTITYLKVNANNLLDKLFLELYSEFKKNGFEINLPNEKYVPHITLARKTKYKNIEELNNVQTDEILIDCDNITLFYSHRIDGKLVYEPIQICRLDNKC